MRKFFTFLLTLITGVAIAQCGNNNTLVAGSLTPPGPGQSTSLTFNSGQYVLAFVQGGANYQVSTCGGTTGGGPSYDTQLTAYDDATGTFLAYNDDYCGLQSQINFTPSSCGYVRILLTQYSCNRSNLPWTVTMTQNTAGTTQSYTLPAVTSQTNVSCFGAANGTASVQVTGTTGTVRYNWAPSGGTNAAATGLSPGIYTVTVTDLACQGTIQTYTITQPTALTATSSFTNVSCFGSPTGSAEVTAGGGTAPYTYTWSPSGGNAALASGLTAGTYTNTVADANGCTKASVVTIAEPTLLSSSVASGSISCFGGNNGSATVTATGGTTPYTYLWSTAATTSVITNQTAGVKTVTVTDAKGCTTSSTVGITQPATAISTSTAVANVLCFGNSTGSATITASGGTPGYTYLWSTAATSSVITGQPAGVRTVTVTDANGCTSTNAVSITQPAMGLATSTAVTNVLCFGNSTGSATVTASGGTGAYTYVWSTAATTSVITNQPAGVKTVTVTDANACTSTNTVNITQPAMALATSTAVSNVLCFGNSTGSATVTASGGTPGYTYLWSTAATGSVITSQPAGVKTVTVTDANGCTATNTVSITEPATAVGTFTAVTNVLCFGNSTGSATVTASGGTGAYTYLWSTAATTSVITNQPAGVKTVTVTDANGCTATNMVNITQPATAITTSTAATNVLCFGNSTGSATVTASGGTGAYTYLWSTAATTSVITNQPAGVKTVTVTDANGCISTNAVSITQPAGALATSTAVTNVLCFGNSTGSATVTATGGTAGYTYLWSTAATTSVITSQPAGVKTVTVTDANGCSATNTVNIVQPLAAVGTSTAATNVLCFGNSTGSATVTASGGTPGYTYLWSTAATGSVIVNQPAGVKTVTVTDANGCATTNTVNITQPATAITTSTAAANVLCFGNSTGSATVTASGGTGAYTYAWSMAATTSVITNQPAGVKTVTVTDANGCVSTNTVTITQPATAVTTSTAVTNVLCFGNSTGSATVTASGGTPGYTYVWSTGAPTPVISNQPAGVKTVTVTDANGCTATNTVSITEPATAVSTSTAATNVLCFGNSTGSATVTATGGTPGYTYLWSTASTSSVIVNQPAGVRTVTVTDANGCATTNTVSITQPAGALATSTAVTNVLCFSNTTGSATVTATGGTAGYSYLWSTAATTSVITNQPAGVRTVTVTDANGCTTTNTVSITQPAAGLNATQTQTNVTCTIDGRAEVAVTGGTSPYTYTWSPAGGNAATSATLSAGSYTCLVQDANGCTLTRMFSITANTVAPVVAVSGNTAICNGSTATLNVSGADTYTWSTGATTTSISVAPVSTTVYSVTGTKAVNGCTTTETYTLIVNANPTLSISVSQASVCPGQSSTLTASGATSYTWSTGSNAPGITVAPESATIYTVSGTNPAGCTSSAAQMISLFPAPSLNLGSIGTLSGSVCAGSSATLAASGVSTYTWSTGSNNASIIVTPASLTTYSVAGTDLNSCVATASISLGIMNTPTLSVSASHTGICPGFTSNLSVSGASTYAWSNNETNATITVSPASTTVYTVVGTNTSGCVSSATLGVTVYPGPTVSLGPDVDVAAQDTYQFNPSQTGAVSYTWSPATYLSATDILNPTVTPEGDADITYVLTVSSVDGCLASDTIVVTVLNELIIANYMSPNGDGQNDTWKLNTPRLIKNYSVTIIDSYGKTVYSKTDNYNNEFDGKLGGNDLPDGVYYYFIKDKDKTKYKGSITLTK